MNIGPSSNPSSILLGSKGAIIVSNTAENTGLFFAVKAISDCIVDSVSFEDRIAGSLNGSTIKGGDSVFLFRITSFKLISGSAILYKAVSTESIDGVSYRDANGIIYVDENGNPIASIE